jgi:type VI protein secretion system component Hcp
MCPLIVGTPLKSEHLRACKEENPVAYQLYMSIDGTRQGKISGVVSHTGKPRSRFTDGFEVFGFSFGVVSPRDISSGLASGMRRYQPIKITKEIGTASPSMFQNVITNPSFLPPRRLPNSAGILGSSGSGSTSGNRQHQPVVITKELDPASPKLFQMLVSNELLKSVHIWFSRVGPGNTHEWHTLKLTNASVVNIEHVAIPGSTHPGEEIEFAYERLETRVGPPA